MDQVSIQEDYVEIDAENRERTKQAMRILVVDDDRIALRLVSRILQNFGHDVITASDGTQAWNILQEEPVSLVITDWMMPGMDGLELCRRIRSGNLAGYVYVILLTAKGGSSEVLQAMEAGVDDYVVKSFDKRELNARIRAGERILKLQKELEERNKKLSESNRKLSEAYSVIKKDLEAGAKIQSSLLPQSASIICGVQFDWIFLPSAFVAGDIFNYFRLDENHVGFYVLDVAGHGIPAAMLSVTLSKVLSPTNHQECLLKQFMPVPEPPYYKIITPAMAVRSLNERFQADDDTMQYFTMLYGIIDTRSGETLVTQAGHPPPILLKKGTTASLIGTGGYPVGMLPDLGYDDKEIHLERGDRFILYSDGMTECASNDGGEFSVERLMKILEKGRNLALRELMVSVEESLRLWKGDSEFEDDMTLLAMEIV